MINVPRKLAIAAGVTATALLGLTAGPGPAGATSYASIDGSGSSWSAVALDQWGQDLASNGITINFTPDGSAAGRTDYINGQDDFAASDPPFRNGSDKIANSGSELPTPFGYSYVPDTAGGTAFMYHLFVGNHQITNMRLSEQTIMKIFTGQITNWDNSEITHDYGQHLPSIPIIPVVRSDGSGATFFLTRWMSHVFTSQWDAFCSQVTKGRVSSNCGETEFYPTSGWGNVQAENGSNNVATYITSSYANGAIGYDEYAYALNSHYPVVSMANPGGYYVQPTASNVAVALTQAQINETPSSPDFLQQNLDNVYTFTDPRSYPLSSYSYLIVPRQGAKLPNHFSQSQGAGATLSTYIDFFLCGGQQQSASLGYSPLPLNLVKGGLQQADNIPGHAPGPNTTTLAGCNNPTFTNGQLTVLKNAPYPTACQKVTAPLNCGSGGKTKTPGSSTKPGSTSGSPSTGPSGAVNPAGGSNTTGPGTTGTGSPVTGQSVSLASNGVDQPVFGALTALAIVAAIALPPGVGLWLRRRRRRGFR